MGLRCLLTAGLAAASAATVAAQRRDPGPTALPPARDSLMTLVARAQYGPDSADPNGWLLNPTWRIRRPNVIDVCGFRAGGDELPPQRSLLIEKDRRCSGQWTVLRLSEPGVPIAGGVACNQGNIEGTPHGHVNYFPVTMIGRMYQTHLFADGDVDFDLGVDLDIATSAGNEHPDEVHVEFNLAEVFGPLIGTGSNGLSWWRDLHRALLRGGAEADRMTHGLPAIVTGLLGIDEVHHWVELHPAYAVAIRFDHGRDAAGAVVSRWAFFVRDRGNKGNCSAHVIPYHPPETSGRMVHRTLIPWQPGATGVELVEAARAWQVGDARVDGIVAEPGAGVELAISMPPATKEGTWGVAIGQIGLRWTGVTGEPAPSPWIPPIKTGRSVHRAKAEGENRLIEVIAHPEIADTGWVPLPSLQAGTLTPASVRAPAPVAQWSPLGDYQPRLSPPVMFCRQLDSRRAPQCFRWTRLLPEAGFGWPGLARLGLGVELFPADQLRWKPTGSLFGMEHVPFGLRLRAGWERYAEGDNRATLALDLVRPVFPTGPLRPYLVPAAIEVRRRRGADGYRGDYLFALGTEIATGLFARPVTEIRVRRPFNSTDRHLALLVGLNTAWRIGGRRFPTERAVAPPPPP